MSSKLVIKGFQVGSKVDQTGLKTIYQGVEIATGRNVFVTVMSVRPGRTMNALLKRAKLSTRLNHTGLITALACGTTHDEKFYFVHQATPSFPVQQGLDVIQDKEQRLLSLIHYMEQVLEALDYLHRAKTTHRDLQTAYVRVDGKDRVILEGYINGRPKTEGRNIINMVNLPYLSPEQLRGAPCDQRSDIYGAGVILYELLTGQLPYESNYTKVEDARQGIIPSPSKVKADIAPELDRIVMKALAPRSSRYKHARQMLEDLHGLKRQQSIWMRLSDFAGQLRKLIPIGR